MKKSTKKKKHFLNKHQEKLWNRLMKIVEEDKKTDAIYQYTEDAMLRPFTK